MIFLRELKLHIFNLPNYAIYYLYLSRYLICISQDGNTALICAATNGHLDVVNLLLDRGANREAANNVIILHDIDGVI